MTSILVVEDEALIAGDIQRTLVRLGYEVPMTVGTGAGAIEAAEALRPDLVLMDIKLRGKMDGIEAASVIRAKYGAPVVYLTSHSDEATLSRAVETHPYGYLLKPFDDRELRTAIAVAIQKHQLESRLAQRERWFATTLRSIGDAVIATDPSQIILFMNGVAEKLTGWGAEAIGRPIGEVFRVVDGAGHPLHGSIGAALDQSFAVQVPSDTGLMMKSGGRIPIDDSAAPIVDDDGSILGGVVVFRDITERKRLEERLARTERMASLGTMAAGMAHEINNPLAYVMANVAISRETVHKVIERLRLSAPEEATDVLASTQAALADVHLALSDAVDGADRVRHIVQDLKKFVGTDDTKREVLDLPVVLEAAIKITNSTVRHHAIVRRTFGTTPYVEANEGQLAQVFTNLLINGAQAIGDGSADKNEISVTTRTDDAGQAVVEIRDTGPGIRPEVLPRIFDPFFTTKPVGSGMGLGLAICHSIMTSLGGELTAENAKGRGALFRVTLPAARTPARPKHESIPASQPTRRGKVLIVDDEAPVAMSMARVLSGSHDVTVVSDGREALRKVAAGDAYDIIFCDLMMPTVSGMDVYESLVVANPEQARRLVFMTGGAFSPRAREFLESTANVHITKPFSLEAIRAVVSDFLK